MEPGFEPLTPWHATVADRRGIDALTGADPLTTTLVRAPEPVRNGQHHPYGDLRPLPEPSSPGEDPYADEFAQSSAEFARHAAFDEPTPARGTPALGDEPGLPPVFTPYHPAPVPVASQARPLPEQAPASVPPEVVPIPVMPPLPTAANSALTMPTGGYPVPPPGLRPSLPAELSGPVPSAPPADAPLAAMAEAATRAVPPATEQRLPSGPGRDAEPPAETDDGMSLGARFGMAFAEPPLPQRPSQTSRPGMLGSRPGVPTQHSAPGGLADPGRRLPAPDVVPPPGAGNGEFATGENDAPDRAALDAQRNPADRAGLDDRRNGAGASGAADRRPSEHGAAQQIPQAAAAGPEHGRGERGDVPPPPGLPGQPTFVSQVRPYLPPAPQPHLPQPAAQQHAAQQAGRPAEGQPEGDQPGAEHLPQRVPAVPDVPPAIHPVVEPEPQVAATPQLDRIASHLRRDDVPTEERPDGFDVDAVLRAVRGVAGVRDAALRTTATGAHHLRLDLAEGADPAAISRMVARMLQEQMGIDAAPAGPVVPRPAPASDTPPPTATLPAPRSGAGAAPPPGLTGAHPDPLSDALPREPRRRHPVSVPRRAPGELRDRVAALRSVSSEPELPAAASPPPLPTERDQGPRAIIEHVQTSTFGLDATVEVRLNTGDRQAVGVASGPAVDAYVLRLCAAATAVAIDDLLREGTTTGESGRCFIEQATIVPMGSCEVAVVVVLLVCGGWVEQLAGSALVAGDPRRAVVRATLSAVNRRLAALLP